MKTLLYRPLLRVRALTATLVLLLLFAVFVTIVWAITFGQVDDFEGGTTQGWTDGKASPFAPTNVASGGPAGADDNYLNDTSSGAPGDDGGKMVMLNEAQWTGDYVAAGVTSISAHMANFGAAPLYMRIGVESADGTRYVSATPVVVPTGGSWQSEGFMLDDANMTLVGGSAPLSTVLANVTQFRLLSRQSNPGWQGDAIVGDLGVDNITAGGGNTAVALSSAGATATTSPAPFLLAALLLTVVTAARLRPRRN